MHTNDVSKNNSRDDGKNDDDGDSGMHGADRPHAFLHRILEYMHRHNKRIKSMVF